MSHDELRRAWFPDWKPEKEDAPQGIRSLVGGGTPPLMQDPQEDYRDMQSSVPGDSPRENPLWAYSGENPYSTKMPSELRVMLNDPNVQGEQRKLVMAAFRRLKSLEDGKLSGR